MCLPYSLAIHAWLVQYELPYDSCMNCQPRCLECFLWNAYLMINALIILLDTTNHCLLLILSIFMLYKCYIPMLLLLSMFGYVLSMLTVAVHCLLPIFMTNICYIHVLLLLSMCWYVQSMLDSPPLPIACFVWIVFVSKDVHVCMLVKPWKNLWLKRPTSSGNQWGGIFWGCWIVLVFSSYIWGCLKLISRIKNPIPIEQLLLHQKWYQRERKRMGERINLIDRRLLGRCPIRNWFWIWL